MSFMVSLLISPCDLRASVVILFRLSFDDREDVFLVHQEEFLVADFELLAGVAREEDAVAGLHLQRLARAVVGQFAFADADDRAAGWLVLSRVGEQDAAGSLGFRFFTL